MNYNKKTVKDVDVKGKKVLLRCDFNVPMAKDGSGVITDDKRIRAALPTIQYLLDQGAAVIACSHMGKPKGEVKPELSLKPVAVRLGELAAAALIAEVELTPKPGLVDRANSGSHRDMDIFTFMDSSAGLWPYFAQCVRAGRETACRPAPEISVFFSTAWGWERSPSRVERTA